MMRRAREQLVGIFDKHQTESKEQQNKDFTDGQGGDGGGGLVDWLVELSRLDPKLFRELSVPGMFAAIIKVSRKNWEYMLLTKG